MLFVCSSEGNGEKEFELMKALRSKQVDGLIIAPNNLSRDGIDYLKKESFSFCAGRPVLPQHSLKLCSGE